MLPLSVEAFSHKHNLIPVSDSHIPVWLPILSPITHVNVLLTIWNITYISCGNLDVSIANLEIQVAETTLSVVLFCWLNRSWDAVGRRQKSCLWKSIKWLLQLHHFLTQA